ncbi:autotransporter-associated beta strand repeat-containing protein, partial [Polynucleobacter sp. AP-Latsch-80-C2]
TLTAHAITLASSSAISITNSGAGSIDGIIAGTGVTLTKAGVGTLTLGNATTNSTYSGGTTVNGGTLKAGSSFQP